MKDPALDILIFVNVAIAYGASSFAAFALRSGVLLLAVSSTRPACMQVKLPAVFGLETNDAYTQRPFLLDSSHMIR